MNEALALNSLLGVRLNNIPGMPGLAPAPVAFTVDTDNALKETRAELDPGSGRIALFTERLDFTSTLLQEACRRMEPEHREFSPERWALQFPGANFHPICALTVTHH